MIAPGVLIPVMPNLKAACIDVSVVSSFTQAHRDIAKTGFNAERAALVKKGDGLRLSPVDHGNIRWVYNKGADIVFKAIGRAISKIDRVEVPVTISRLKERYSFAWQTMMGSALCLSVEKQKIFLTVSQPRGYALAQGLT